MKSAFLFMVVVFFSVSSPDIADIRKKYRYAAENQEKAEELYQELSSKSDTDDILLSGYRGASATIMAKYAKGISSKTSYFKEGKQLIEEAIASAPENVELRYIRLSVQENAPKIVRYRNDIPDDKQFILDHYGSLEDADAKRYIKGFVSQSSSFTTAEKEQF